MPSNSGSTPKNEPNAPGRRRLRFNPKLGQGKLATCRQRRRLNSSCENMLAAVTVRTTIERPWTTMNPIRLGDVPSGGGTPDRYLTVENEGTPAARIDFYAGTHLEARSFESATIWREWLVFGFGERLFLLRLGDTHTKTIDLGSYFGDLYPFESFVLIASCERLFRLHADGEVAWSTDVLGIDGVVVSRVDGNTIVGEGEWDPPGGWRPFRLDLRTGISLSANSPEG